MGTRCGYLAVPWGYMCQLVIIAEHALGLLGLMIGYASRFPDVRGLDAGSVTARCGHFSSDDFGGILLCYIHIDVLYYAARPPV